MDNNAAVVVLSNYEQLLQLSRQQLTIASQLRSAEQLDELSRLEEQKQNYKLMINRYTANEHDYQQILVNHQHTLIEYVEQLQLLNDQLQQKITTWYGEDSLGMKQVSNHRKTLHAYGGLANSDIIPYYFDEKK